MEKAAGVVHQDSIRVVVHVLAEVPDVAVFVLRQIIPGFLYELPVLVLLVQIDHRLNTVYGLGLRQDFDLDPLGDSSLLGGLVRQFLADREREVFVGDFGGEIGRVDLRVVLRGPAPFCVVDGK